MPAPSRLPFPPTRHVVEGHAILRNFFSDRCPHLAAMVAYYALLSFVPLLFLAASLVGLLGTQDEQSDLVQAVRSAIPGASAGSVVSLVTSLQRNSTSLGLIGAFGLLWSSLGFLSALESALNIIYDVPNRAFLRQKLFVFGLVTAGLAATFAGLVLSSVTQNVIERVDPSLRDGDIWRVGFSLVVVSTISFGFLFAVYRWLPNTPLTSREILPGTATTAILLVVSFQAVPLYLRVVEALPALEAFGGAVVTLVWLYLMGNLIMLGAEVNWWWGRGRVIARANKASEAREPAELGTA